MRLHGVAVQEDFAAAAERHAGGRTDYRERRVFQRLVDLLAAGDEFLDLAPRGDVRGEYREPQVGADREIGAFVVNHERFVFLLHERDRLAQQAHGLVIERIALAREFEAKHAVADVPDRRRGVLEHGLGDALDVLEHQHAVGARQLVIGAVGAEILPLSVGDAIKAATLGGAEQRGNTDAVAREFFREPIGAEFIDELERAPLPVVAEAHRLVDRGYVVGGFRYERCRVRKRLADHAPGIAADLAVGGEQRAQVFGGAGQFRELRFLFGTVCAGSRDRSPPWSLRRRCD